MVTRRDVEGVSVLFFGKRCFLGYAVADIKHLVRLAVMRAMRVGDVLHFYITLLCGTNKMAKENSHI